MVVDLSSSHYRQVVVQLESENQFLMRSYHALVTVFWFAVASIAMTISTAVAIWFGHGGHPPLTVADAWIYFADWPTVLLHGIDFYVASGQVFLVNLIGWSLVGLIIGGLFPGSQSTEPMPTDSRRR
jgi:hypothetical protein